MTMAATSLAMSMMHTKEKNRPRTKNKHRSPFQKSKLIIVSVTILLSLLPCLCSANLQDKYPNRKANSKLLLTSSVIRTPTTKKCNPSCASNVSLYGLRGGGVRRSNKAVVIKNAATSSRAGLSDRSRQRLTVLLVATALFNDTLQLTMLLPIIPTLIASPPPLGVSANAEIAMGVFFASKDICQLTFAPIAGILTARTSSNAALALSTACLGLATFVFADAKSFKQLLIARSVQGAASAAVLCGGLSLIAETHAMEARGSAMGMAYTGLALGVLCGPLIGGLLFEKIGRRQTFRLAAAIVVANAIAQIALMTLAPAVKSEDKKVADEKPVSAADSFKAISTNSEVLAVAAAIFCINAVMGVIKPLSQIVLDREFQMTMVQRSFVITIATLTYLIGTPIAGYLSDRMPRSRLLGASLLLAALSSVFFALRGLFGLGSFFVSVSLLGLSLAFNGSVAQALLADLVDRHKLGKYSMAFALSDMADSLGLIIGPILGLAVSQMYGASSGVGLVGMFCLVLLPFVLKIP